MYAHIFFCTLTIMALEHGEETTPSNGWVFPLDIGPDLAAVVGLI
jgi:hypothetical protein